MWDDVSYLLSSILVLVEMFFVVNVGGFLRDYKLKRTKFCCERELLNVKSRWVSNLYYFKIKLMVR